MTLAPSLPPYSFSMINMLKLLPEWSWDGFNQVMAHTGTNLIELVPSMVLGKDWDQQIEEENGSVQQALERLMQGYKVTSIQSLTYGLQINLADKLIYHPEFLMRLNSLKVLAKTTGCSVLILGSPGQKKQLGPAVSDAEHKQRFMDNCSWIASKLGPELILSLEHNTSSQGAEYCNTFLDIVDVVATLKRQGIANVGVNLDTKCLVNEFGAEIRVGKLLVKPELADLVTSIQVSYDFLARDTHHSAQDHLELAGFAHVRNIPLSLEEFGLQGSQVDLFVQAWKSRI